MDRPIEFTAGTFTAAALASFSLGALWGVRSQLKREQVAFANQCNQRAAAALAARALGLGTLLCVGVFAGAGAAFSYSTGISTVQDFAAKMQRWIPKKALEETGQRVGIDGSEQVKEERRLFKSLGQDFEMKFWSKYFTNTLGLQDDKSSSSGPDAKEPTSDAQR